jgi:hypothetical protein
MCHELPSDRVGFGLNETFGGRVIEKIA